MEQEGITNSAASSHYMSQITNLISFHASYANSDGLVSSHVPGQVLLCWEWYICMDFRVQRFFKIFILQAIQCSKVVILWNSVLSLITIVRRSACYIVVNEL